MLLLLKRCLLQIQCTAFSSTESILTGAHNNVEEQEHNWGSGKSHLVTHAWLIPLLCVGAPLCTLNRKNQPRRHCISSVCNTDVSLPRYGKALTTKLFLRTFRFKFTPSNSYRDRGPACTELPSCQIGTIVDECEHGMRLSWHLFTDMLTT